MKPSRSYLSNFFIHYPFWGKLCVAFFGYLLAGPIGALFGVFLGNFFDIALLEYYKNPLHDLHSERSKEEQHLFLRACFSIMGYIAKADGRISELEITIARQFMQELKLNQEQKKLAKHFFSLGKQPDFDLSDLLNEVETVCHGDPSLLMLFLDIQYRSALLGGFRPEKESILSMIFQRFGFAPLHLQRRFQEDLEEAQFSSTRKQSGRYHYQESSSQRNTYHQHNTSYTEEDYSIRSVDQAYAVLEVSKEANLKEVKSAYRRLISRNHPDKLIAKGLPESAIKNATNKTQQIRKAYEQICSYRGWTY